MRELTHPVVHERKKLIEGLGIALPPATEKVRDVGGERHPDLVRKESPSRLEGDPLDCTPAPSGVKHLGPP
jgi:hypothetical protein